MLGWKKSIFFVICVISRSSFPKRETKLYTQLFHFIYIYISRFFLYSKNKEDWNFKQSSWFVMNWKLWKFTNVATKFVRYSWWHFINFVENSFARLKLLEKIVELDLLETQIEKTIARCLVFCQTIHWTATTIAQVNSTLVLNSFAHGCVNGRCRSFFRTLEKRSNWTITETFFFLFFFIPSH